MHQIEKCINDKWKNKITVKKCRIIENISTNSASNDKFNQDVQSIHSFRFQFGGILYYVQKSYFFNFWQEKNA